MSKAQSRGVRFRWFAENCCEFVLPGGKHLLVDPMLPDPATTTDPMTRTFISGYTVDDLKRVDYVFITHTHFDHIGDLKKVCDKFDPVVLVNEACASLLIRGLDLPVRQVMPLGHGRYDFGDFAITTVPGTHVPAIGDKTYSESVAMFGASGDPLQDELNALGGTFNLNFILDVPGGLRIDFMAGEYSPITKSAFMDTRPSLLLRQLTVLSRFPEAFDQLIECMDDTRCGIAAFICHHQPSKEAEKSARELNEVLEQKNRPARMFVPKQGEWLNLHVALD